MFYQTILYGTNSQLPDRYRGITFDYVSIVVLQLAQGPTITSVTTAFAVANNGRLPCICQVELPLLMGSQYVRITFQVVPQLLHDMIIGRDCLTKYKARIEYEKDIMQMDVIEGLFCTETVSIQTKDKQKDIATGALAKPNKHNSISAAMLGKQLVIIRDGKTQVLCVNQTLKPIVIRQGQKIAVAQTAGPYTRGPVSLRNLKQNDESYQQYRRTDKEYGMTINKMDFENSVLTPAEEQTIKQAIWGERDVLSVEEDIGNLRNFEHEIPMKDLSNFSGRAYRLSPDAREVLRRELQHHKNQGVIQPFMSEYSSPCILVRKEPYKTGPILNAKCPLVVDLRRLNIQCEKTKYCLPHVAETIFQLEHQSLQYMSLIDLTKVSHK